MKLPHTAMLIISENNFCCCDTCSCNYPFYFIIGIPAISFGHYFLLVLMRLLLLCNRSEWMVLPNFPCKSPLRPGFAFGYKSQMLVPAFPNFLRLSSKPSGILRSLIVQPKLSHCTRYLGGWNIFRNLGWSKPRRQNEPSTIPPRSIRGQVWKTWIPVDQLGWCRDLALDCIEYIIRGSWVHTALYFYFILSPEFTREFIVLITCKALHPTRPERNSSWFLPRAVFFSFM